MKKIKLLFMLICCLITLGITVETANAEEKTITLDGDWVSGSLEDDVCFYKFTIPSSGTVTYTFQSYSDEGALCLKDETLSTTYSKIECDGSPSNPKADTNSLILEQGTYVLKVYRYNLGYTQYERNWTGTYRLKISFSPANNNETEPNDTFETAMVLNENQQINGLISDNESIDFYKFTIDKPQTVNIFYRFDDKFIFSVWNSDFLAITDYYQNSPEIYAESGSYNLEKYLEPGTYYIKIEGGYNSGTYTLKWQSQTYVSSIKLKKSKLTLNNGKKYNLLSSVVPSNATDKSLTWTSSDSSIASVDSSGKVTAKKTGAATITATSQDGSNVSAVCNVIVFPKKEKITKISCSERKVKVQFRGQNGASGYEVMYSADKHFKKKKSIFISDSTNITTSKLSKNKKYYFKVRAYFADDKNYFGAWSDVKTLKTKKN